jgi:hypothetical protein
MTAVSGAKSRALYAGKYGILNPDLFGIEVIISLVSAFD